MKLILASNNAHKLREMKEILSPFFDEIVSMKEAGIDYVYQTVYELTYNCLIRLLEQEAT